MKIAVVAIIAVVGIGVVAYLLTTRTAPQHQLPALQPAAGTPPPPRTPGSPPPSSSGPTGGTSINAGTGAAVPLAPATASVTIQNFAFSPPELRVKAGTVVTWTNRDSVGHTVTNDSGVFGSALLAPGRSFAHTFAEKGGFEYHCSPHPFMTARVIVE